MYAHLPAFNLEISPKWLTEDVGKPFFSRLPARASKRFRCSAFSSTVVLMTSV